MPTYKTICRECKGPKPVSMGSFCQPCWTLYGAAMRAANAAVNKARRQGLLPPASVHKCSDCDRQAFDYDHRDYDKPLAVEPVCRACNFKRGGAHWTRPDAEPAKVGA